ncbi:MAG TPA: hypothetical protein VF174_12025, partial [Micromonosporaceae bacterium]
MFRPLCFFFVGSGSVSFPADRFFSLFLFVLVFVEGTIMTVFGRWLRAIGETSAVRNAALGVGALALAGGALAGPAAS